MADGTLDIEIKIDDKVYQSELKKSEKKAKSSGEKSGKNYSSGFSSGLSGLAGTAAKVAASLAAVFGTRAIINAAATQEAAVQKLNTALKVAGDFSESASQDMQKFAGELQKVTKFGDESTLEMLALAKSMGATNEQAKQIVTTGADVAEALGVDFATAVRSVSQTLAGTSGTLGRYVGSLRGLTAEQLKAGAGIDLLAKQFSGNARGAIDTFGGATTQLSNAFGDMLEEIGFLITKNPFVIKGIKILTEEFGNLTEGIKGLGGSSNIILSMVDSIITAGNAIKTYLVAPIEIIGRVFPLVISAIQTGLQSMVAGVGQLGGLLGKVIGFFKEDSEVAIALTNFKDSTAEVFDTMAADTAMKMSGLLDPLHVTEGAEAILAKVRELREKVIAETNKMNSSRVSSTIKAENNLTGSANHTSKLVIASAQQMAAGVSTATQATVMALLNGQNGFKSFGKAVLGIIGDMAINIGQTLIAIGLGIDALKAALGTLTGGLAIAAGVALVALGTVLKDAAGSAMVNAAAGAGAGAGAGGGGGSFSPPTEFTPATDVAATLTEDSLAPVDEELKRDEPKTVVNVNIEGNILDGDETGLRIVDVLNRAFDTQGVVLRA